jgi:hypothetical protein
MDIAVRFATECINALRDHVSNAKFLESFAGKARRFHTEVYYLGPHFVLATAASRSSALFALEGLRGSNCSAVVSSIAGRLGPSEDEAGYGLYAAVFAYGAAKQLGLRVSSLEDAVWALGENRAGWRLLYRYAQWLKMLAEAYFK